jgi:hypothetical protein
MTYETSNIRIVIELILINAMLMYFLSPNGIELINKIIIHTLASAFHIYYRKGINNVD